MRSPSTRCRAVVLACVIAIGVALCGCGGDDEPAASDPPTTTAPSTQPSSTLSPEAEDERALRQLAEDWFEAVQALYGGTASPDVARTYLVDRYLEGFLAQLRQFKNSGNTAERDPRSTHVVTRITVQDDDGLVEECVVDADSLLGPDGSILNDEVVTKRYETSALRTEDGWRFNDRMTVSEQQGEALC